MNPRLQNALVVVVVLVGFAFITIMVVVAVADQVRRMAEALG